MNPGRQVDFHASCGHLISAPGRCAEQDVRCPHCHQAVRVPAPDVPYASPVAVPAGAVEPTALTALYLTALLGVEPDESEAGGRVVSGVLPSPPLSQAPVRARAAAETTAEATRAVAEVMELHLRGRRVAGLPESGGFIRAGSQA